MSIAKDAIHRPLSLLIATFPYGGNGAAASENPTVGRWVADTIRKAKNDERIVNVAVTDINDTPITMTRNMAVMRAMQGGFDLLLMVDSDMWPDYELERGDTSQEPFWETAFEFAYNHFPAGPVCVGAPYCGCPPSENVFVFKWGNQQTDHPNVDFQLCQYSREEGAQMSGIHEAAALPTGVILFDTRLFELTEPQPDDFTDRMESWVGDLKGRTIDGDLVRAIAERCAKERYRAEQSWFYYEYKHDDLMGKCYQAEKCSTEDVTATRDISLIGTQKLGYNPVFCAWSCWAGHWKPKCVGKPRLLTALDVGTKFKNALTANIDPCRQWIEAQTICNKE